MATVVSAVVVFGAGGIWVQRLEDRQDAETQAGAEEGVFATRAVCSALPSGWPSPAGVQKGPLTLTAEAVSWEHGPSSSMGPVRIERDDIRDISVTPRGLFWRRGSLVISTGSGRALFVTAARVERLRAAVDRLGALEA